MILISAGHYPDDPGGGNNEKYFIVEHFECVKIVNLLEALLIKNRVEYIRVPAVSLSKKIRFINSVKEKITVSIELHLNKFNSITDYMAALYVSDTGKKYSKILGDALLEYLPFRKFKSFVPVEKKAFLSDTRPVSVILEPIFADNDLMCSFLAQPRAHYIIANAIFAGIKNILSKGN